LKYSAIHQNILHLILLRPKKRLNANLVIENIYKMQTINEYPYVSRGQRFSAIQDAVMDLINEGILLIDSSKLININFKTLWTYHVLTSQ
jgi:hypothetical protein